MFLRRDTFGDLFREMSRLQNDMNRMFARPSLAGGILAVNVWEDENSVYAEADVPGVKPHALDVSVTEGNQLTITGERSPVEVAGGSWQRQERGSGSFTRVITLPTLVDANKVQAHFEAGVLRMTLPKAEAAKPRKIPVISR